MNPRILALFTLPGPMPNRMPEKFESNAWYPGAVYVIARQRDGKVLVGGRFDRVSGGIARNNLLRLDADGSLDQNLAPVVAASRSTWSIRVVRRGPGCPAEHAWGVSRSMATARWTHLEPCCIGHGAGLG
ncbi:MAG: delta-60 repeat domain-containing protein [Dokdonella sp.]|uniref:delta-60 repeat domain-containing protein n=1 Tax=Dokdonella sp. TaxID=2291710 RepID=UPI0025BDF63F|nr:delta-60 repeat domain-containing protein [Dokdonella sp.]MBZ0224064.1 delta-60 repeat domain-containing protein [Dokdonella sp.]MCC7255638.1 delta-60 repeat domain-containing protein [Dokdonella sp.]